MPDFDSFWFIYQPYMDLWPECPRNVADSRVRQNSLSVPFSPPTAKDGSAYSQRDKSGLNWCI
jgi:hypothetical protein